MTLAFVFPGQGSQFVGMGRDLSDAFPEARYVFEEVNDALNQNLSNLIFNGPENELILTENTQPALMAVSLAALRVLLKEGNFNIIHKVKFVAGHSLGEYSALTACEALSLRDTARILRARGEAMQTAVKVGEGAMAALLGLNIVEVRQLINQITVKGICEIANDNAPGQVVISGLKTAVLEVIELAKKNGVKRAILLPVSAPFHCSMMQPAADMMNEVLHDVSIVSPQVPLISNVTAKPSTEPDEIRDLLIRQVTGVVRWMDTITYMKDNGIQKILEVGAGKVLSGLNRRIEKDLITFQICSPSDIDKILCEI